MEKIISKCFILTLLSAAILKCFDFPFVLLQRTIEQPLHIIIIQDGDTQEILKLKWAIWKLFSVKNDFFSHGFCCKHLLLLKVSFIFNFAVKKKSGNPFFNSLPKMLRGNAVQVQSNFPAKKLRKIRALKIRMRQLFFL